MKKLQHLVVTCIARYDLIRFPTTLLGVYPAMQVETFLHNLLSDTLHKSRVKSLIPVIHAMIRTKVRQLTQFGRNLNTPGDERAGIRRMDRLLGNVFYQKKSSQVYKAIALIAVGAKKKPIILVDWSGLPNSTHRTIEGEHTVLRATLATEGRGITIYDEVHSKKKEGNANVHKQFLENLKSLLPDDCQPIIVTDAGFKVPWLKAVESLKWDYIARVRGNTMYDDGKGFKSITNLFALATATAKSLGEIFLGKSQKFTTNLYIYKHKLKGRKKLNRNGEISNQKDYRNYSRGYREPWILVSSLTGYFSAKKIVKIYKWRMTIEENFRDVKSIDYGLCMNRNVTRKAERFIVWLMLSALASLIAWITGYTAEQMGLHHKFQANTCRDRRVLSFFYLGCRIITKKVDVQIDLEMIKTVAWGQEI